MSCGAGVLAEPAGARPLAVLDFEASGLGRLSYPIEVGIAYVATGEVRSWLIRPHPVWAEVGEWDPAAERVHGIPRALLDAEGLSVGTVAEEVAAAVAGHAVLSDAPGYDGDWMGKLFRAAGRGVPCRLESVRPILDDLTWSGGLAGAAEIEEAMEVARRRFPPDHRAGNDARFWAEVVRVLAGLEPGAEGPPSPERVR